MKNEFCTYEQSLALKELGFDEHCFGVWDIDEVYYGGLNLATDGARFNTNSGWNNTHYKNNVAAPLKQQAFRWFREKYDLQYWLNDGGMLGKCFIKITGYKHDKFYFSSSEPMEYEEAEDTCLNKLIEIVKNKLI